MNSSAPSAPDAPEPVITPGHGGVALDTSAAETAVAPLRQMGEGTPSANLEACWATLVDTPAYRAWADACVARPDELLATLRSCPPTPDGAVPDGSPAAASGVLSAFADGRNALATLSARAAQARMLPVSEAARRALACLPPGTALPVTVFVLLSGDRQALANDRGEVTIDLQVVPSIPAAPYMLALLAHELHHIGLDWCRQRDPAVARAREAGGPAAAVVTALHMLLSEGAANAFFTPSGGELLRAVAPALVDVYGAAFVEDYTWATSARTGRAYQHLRRWRRPICCGTSPPMRA